MDWLVDREDRRALEHVAGDLDQYVRRHADSVAGFDHTTRTLRMLLERVCRCEGPLARVELDWRSERPTVTVTGMPTGDNGKPPHTLSCEMHAEAVLPARRRHERSFVLERVDPDSLPAAEEFGDDGRVSREPFLKALVVQTTSQVEREFGPDAIDRVITKVGSDIGNRMEDHYRRAHGIVERLTPAQMGELFVGLKQAIGGDFYVITANEEEIVLGNRCCPFGEAVRNSPGLCRMTSSVFGGIAARNAGFSAVCLDERIAIGDQECKVRVLLRPRGALPSHAHRYGGDLGSLRVAVLASSSLFGDSIEEGLSHYGMKVTSCCDDAQTTLQTLADEAIDILLIDLPERDTAKAVDVALTARERQPGLAVVVLCEDPDPPAARRLLAAGPGVGHLLKDAATNMSSFVASLRGVAEGATIVSPGITDALAAAENNELAVLTRREFEALALVADGYSNQAIADRLTIGKRAVEKHLGNVFRKLNLDGPGRDHRVQAGLVYRRAGHSK